MSILSRTKTYGSPDPNVADILVFKQTENGSQIQRHGVYQVQYKKWGPLSISGVNSVKWNYDIEFDCTTDHDDNFCFVFGHYI